MTRQISDFVFSSQPSRHGSTQPQPSISVNCEEMWQERLFSFGGSWSSLVRIADRLLVANQLGQVSVLAASPKFELLNTNAIPTETTCSSLAIASGRMFLRTHAALWCFGNAL